MASARRRGRWIRLPLASVILYAITAPIVVTFVVSGVLRDWAAALILITAAVALFIPIGGYVLLVEWFAVIATFLRQRRRPLPDPVSPAADTTVISGEAGVRADGHILVAVVEVAPNLAVNTETGGRVSSGTELPLSLVASLMNQYGLHLDIDVVEAGCHVPPGTAYRTVYAQFVGPRPVVGARRTWLVLRLNMLDNLERIVERGPSRTAGPKVLAAAAHRVVQRLGQEQIRAHALSAEELDAMTDVLLDSVTSGQGREHWSVMRSGPNFVTTYIGHPEMLADHQLDRWWSWRTEETVTVIRLSGSPSSEDVQVGVFVRYTHHGKAYKPLSEAKLGLPVGIQRHMLDASLPAGDRSLYAPLPTCDFAAVRDVRVPIGPSGQILGHLKEGVLATIGLWDQSSDPKRQRFDAHVGMDLARQLVLRAVVTGAVVAIHTQDRHRWEGLVASVNDEQRLFYATAGARTCDIAVFDGRAVTTVPARTVMRLLDPESEPASGADMTIVERPGQALEVAIGGADPTTVWTIRTREEDRYLGLGEHQPPARRAGWRRARRSWPERRGGRQPYPPSVIRRHLRQPQLPHRFRGAMGSQPAVDGAATATDRDASGAARGATSSRTTGRCGRRETFGLAAPTTRPPATSPP